MPPTTSQRVLLVDVPVTTRETPDAAEWYESYARQRRTMPTTRRAIPTNFFIDLPFSALYVPKEPKICQRNMYQISLPAKCILVV